MSAILFQPMCYFHVCTIHRSSVNNKSFQSMSLKKSSSATSDYILLCSTVLICPRLQARLDTTTRIPISNDFDLWLSEDKLTLILIKWYSCQSLNHMLFRIVSANWYLLLCFRKWFYSLNSLPIVTTWHIFRIIGIWFRETTFCLRFLSTMVLWCIAFILR